MRKALFALVCLFAIMAAGSGLRAQEITITLTPGWTWISYTNAEAMNIADALGDLVPMEGDIVKSQGATVWYQNGIWRGTFQQFIPGRGYHYYSNRTEEVSFVFAQPSSTSVITATTTDITVTSAVTGGMVSLPEGSHVFQRGVCWGTAPSPDLDGNYSIEENGIGSFNTTLVDLNPNTTYYVRAYAVSDYGLAYGNEQSFTTLSGIPVVTTAEVTDVTGNSALCGGTVTDDGGLAITARGVCWSASPNPTLSDSYTTDGTGTGSFTSSLTGLSASTTYYVRAYASNSNGTIYGGEQSFTTEAGSSGDGDHAYVDLGLPSGLLWATCNVGANAPEDYGEYFAWGETTTKSNFNWSTYQYCNGSDNTFTKYCTDANYGYNGFTDNLTTLLPEDDAATANWGSDWRMPTKAEWRELFNNTTVTLTTQNGVNGHLFTARNGNSIFLPATGCRFYSALFYAGSCGYYWSSSLYTETDYAWYFYYDSDNYGVYVETRNYGLTIRPVRVGLQN
jgi:uncharacterized protein (TIGR02145 family)